VLVWTAWELFVHGKKGVGAADLTGKSGAA
jgi:hypothetical protein